MPPEKQKYDPKAAEAAAGVSPHEDVFEDPPAPTQEDVHGITEPDNNPPPVRRRMPTLPNPDGSGFAGPNAGR